jgi:hypothetical protein
MTNDSTPGAHFGIDLVNIEKERGKNKYAITILKGLSNRQMQKGE